MFYPVFLRVAGRPCLVVGGGEVAHRKALSLLEAGARVKVVAPHFAPELEALGERVELVRQAFVPGDLEGTFLAIVATDDRETNHQVAEEAEKRGILVNVVDSLEESSFIVPSLVRRGGLLIAVSTSGKAPALARFLREELERTYGQEYGALLELLAQVRQEALSRGRHLSYESWRESLGPALEALRQGNMEEARKRLALLLEEGK